MGRYLIVCLPCSDFSEDLTFPPELRTKPDHANCRRKQAPDHICQCPECWPEPLGLELPSQN